MSILNGGSEQKKMSAEKIQDKFGTFINMFSSEELTYLYEKRGNAKVEDLGTWVIDSDINYEEKEKLKGCGVVIFF